MASLYVVSVSYSCHNCKRLLQGCYLYLNPFLLSISLQYSMSHWAWAKLQKSWQCLNNIETTALLKTLVPFPSKRRQSWRSNDMCRSQLCCGDVWNPTFLGDRKKLLKINVTKNIVFYSSCSIKTNFVKSFAANFYFIEY